MGAYRRRPLLVGKREWRHRRAEIVRDVLGADRLLGETTLKRGAQCPIAVSLQEGVQALDFGNPRTRAPMRQLGEIGERRGAEINQMLTLQIAAGAFAGDRGDA